MNKEKKKQFIILGVLVLILGIFLFKNLGQLSATPPPVKTAVANAGDGGVPIDVFEDNDAEAIDIDALIQRIKDVEFIYSDNISSRNPSQPTNKVAGPVLPGDEEADSPSSTENIRSIVQRKKVTGIIWDESSPVAVVDEEVVYKGYKFKQYKILVKSIGVDHVVFSFETMDGTTEEITKQLVKEQ